MRNELDSISGAELESMSLPDKKKLVLLLKTSGLSQLVRSKDDSLGNSAAYKADAVRSALL